MFFTRERTAEKNRKCILVSEEYLEKLRTLGDAAPFQNQEEGIFFFKYVKPKFAARLMYNVYLYNFEYKRPRNQYKIDRNYLLQQLKRINQFIEDNVELYKYYRTGGLT